MTKIEADNQRNHYRFLDALRGIAAIFVVIYHIGSRFGGPKIAHNGYLAVDFFFVLSGVVLASAYEHSLGRNLTFRQFAVKRAVRLLPMSIFGVVLGTAYLLLRSKIQPQASDPLVLLLLASLLNILLLPKIWTARATTDETFPANGALWSLFFEFSVNLAWAALLPRASIRKLYLVALVSGVVFAAAALKAGTPDIGWNLSTFWGGAARTVFGFVTGVILYRIRETFLSSSRVGPWFAIGLLVVFIFAPVSGVIWPLLGSLIAMPLAVVFGLMTGKHKIIPYEEALGRISYPLYAIHVPLLMIFSGLQKKLYNHGVVGDWAPLLLIPILIVSYIVLERYDEPVRAYVSSYIRRRRTVAKVI